MSIELPDGYAEKMLINTAADQLPSVGMPSNDDPKQRPITMRIMPDMSVVMWSYAPVEARGGLLSSDGKPIMKIGVKVNVLDPDESFDFFHTQALHWAQFLTQRDNAIKEDKKRKRK